MNRHMLLSLLALLLLAALPMSVQAGPGSLEHRDSVMQSKEASVKPEGDDAEEAAGAEDSKADDGADAEASEASGSDEDASDEDDADEEEDEEEEE